MAWSWREVGIPGAYQPGAICRETAGSARSIRATPSVFLVADGMGNSVQVTNRTAVAIASGRGRESIRPALESVVVANDQPETLGLRPVASLDSGAGTSRVFSLDPGSRASSADMSPPPADRASLEAPGKNHEQPYFSRAKWLSYRPRPATFSRRHER